MTLLTICQNIADNIPITKPTSIINNTSKEAKLLLACAKKAGEQIARRPERGWVAMQQEHTFTTVNGTASYSLPSDFRWLIDETLWDQSNYWELKGPLSPKDWQSYKSSILGDTLAIHKRFRIKGTSGTKFFFIDPTPTAAENFVFEYVSNQWCESSGGTGQTTWAADTDVGVIDEYLIELEATWRVLSRLGMDYTQEYKDSEQAISTALGHDGGAAVINIGKGTEVGLLTSANAPDTGFG